MMLNKASSFISRIILLLVMLVSLQRKLVSSQTTLIQNGSVCINGPSFHYNGTQNVTRSNTPCLRWDSAPANLSIPMPADGGHHSYCRNPISDPSGIYCYTNFENLTRQYCYLPKCDSDSRVIWTGYNVVNRTSHLFALHADPELIRQNLTPRRTVNVDHYFNSTGTQTEFWTLTSDYDSRKLFFVDYRAEYIGVHSFNTSSTQVFYDGMGHGIESLAYDKMSQNLYWTDSTLKWVMATDSAFQFYTIVHRTAPDPAYALALHSSRRYLFFTTYRNLNSKMYRSDLAGQNVQVILQYPAIDDVTGLTIDYSEDRIYWTDFVGTGSKIGSAALDGTNVTKLYTSRTSIYWSLGVYLNYVYVTDVRTRFNRQGRRTYYIFMINKNKAGSNTQVLNYGLSSKPRGITIFSKNNTNSSPSVAPNGECSASSACDQICLPSLTGRRVCACSLGYVKQNDTGCTTQPITDESIVLVDAGQGKIFHIPVTLTSTSSYKIIPIDTETRISSIAVNVPQRYLYWSDPTNSSILRSTIDGGSTIRVLNGKHAKTIAIDQQTGNVFFSDDDFEQIYVMTIDGLYLKTLYKAPPSRSKISSIVSLAIDMRNKFIYWTDTNSAIGKGQLWRMRLDGSQATPLISNLTRPSAVTIDLQSDSLYLGEGTIPLIYAFPLANVSNSNGLVIDPNVTTTYDLRASFRRRGSTLLSAIKVLNGRVFVYDYGNRSVEVFDLARGPSSIKKFGPREFFRVRAMNIFSMSYYRNYEAIQGNPCNISGRLSATCNQLCLAVTNFTYDCDCQDGWGRTNFRACVDRSTKSTDNPPTALSCEADRTIEVEACQNNTRVTWGSPSWLDDVTASAALRITTPNMTSPALLSIGRHVFRYTATDVSNNVGVCSFTIIVTATTCGARPSIPPAQNIRQTTPTCSSDPNSFFYGSLAYIMTCVSGENISFGPVTNSSLTNDCMAGGRWRYTNVYGIRCGPLRTNPFVTSIPATTGGTSINPTNIPGQTTFVPVRTTTPIVATTGVETTTTPRTTTPRTTTPRITTPRTTTPRTTSSLTTTERTTTRATTRGSPTTTATTTSSTTTSKKPPPGVAKKSTNVHALSTGAIAGIVVLVVALIAIVAGVLYVRSRKPGGGISFPWKRQEDRAGLNENVFDDINHYTVL